MSWLSSTNDAKKLCMYSGKSLTYVMKRVCSKALRTLYYITNNISQVRIRPMNFNSLLSTGQKVFNPIKLLITNLLPASYPACLACILDCKI